MHRKETVSSQVFKHIYPFSTKSESHQPASWSKFVKENLMPEVLHEVKLFYGDVSGTDEIRYPGLDYNHASHRRRLGRYSYHRRLFSAFDELGLTEKEIFELCNWDRTLCQQLKICRENKIEIKDTTGDDIYSALGSDKDGKTQDLPLVKSHSAIRSMHNEAIANELTSTILLANTLSTQAETQLTMYDHRAPDGLTRVARSINEDETLIGAVVRRRANRLVLSSS